MKTDKFNLLVYCNFLVLLSTTVCSQNINKQNVNIADETLTDYNFLSRYHYNKSKNYLKRRYRIRHWIPMFIGTPCIYPSIHPSIYHSSFHPPIYPSIRRLSVCLSWCLSVCLPACLPARLSIYLSIYYLVGWLPIQWLIFSLLDSLVTTIPEFLDSPVTIVPD